MAIKFVLKQSGSNGRGAKGSPPAEYAFDGALFTLGSNATNDLILTGSAGEQAVIIREDDRLTLINGADGTQVNGEKLRREAIHPLGGGDEIRVGNYTISVVDDEDGGNNNGNHKSAPLARETEAPAPTFDKISIAETNDKNQHSRAAEERAEQNGAEMKTPSRDAKSSNNFAAVLDTLRTEEDSFYFVVKTLVKNKETETARVALEQSEIPIGADDKNEIVFDIKKMSAVFGVVRKDWSGIVLQANRNSALFVNNEALAVAGEPRRLRNDDRVSFAAPVKSVLVLHEPSLLVALEPLLSARNGASGGAAVGAAAVAVNDNQISTIAPRASKPKLPLFERTFFKYFSFVEILTMIIGTLIGAVLFFLIFEFMFS